MPPYKPKALDFTQTDDRQINDLQRSLSDQTTGARGLPFSDGVLIAEELRAGVMQPGIQFTGGQTKAIRHGLGRAFRGWIWLSPRAGADPVALTQSDQATNLNASQLTLTSMSADTFYVDLLVY